MGKIYYIKGPIEKIKRKIFGDYSKETMWSTHVDMEKVKHYQSLPKNPYTPEEKKKREAEIMAQIKREKEKRCQN